MCIKVPVPPILSPRFSILSPRFCPPDSPDSVPPIPDSEEQIYARCQGKRVRRALKIEVFQRNLPPCGIKCVTLHPIIK